MLFRQLGTLRPILFCWALVAAIAAVEPVFAQSERTTRVVGTVKDEKNAISLPGVPVEVVGTKEVVFTDVDGRFVLQLAPGTHQVAVAMDGYHTKTLTITIVAANVRRRSRWDSPSIAKMDNSLDDRFKSLSPTWKKSVREAKLEA